MQCGAPLLLPRESPATPFGLYRNMNFPRLLPLVSRFLPPRTPFPRSFCSSPAAMTLSQPESAIVPRYLTGDQPGLREFLNKFDVGFSLLLTCPRHESID